MADDKLFEALNKLDQLLKTKALEIEIVICGAYAIKLLGYVQNTFTLDVDSLPTLTVQKMKLCNFSYLA